MLRECPFCHELTIWFPEVSLCDGCQEIIYYFDFEEDEDE